MGLSFFVDGALAILSSNVPPSACFMATLVCLLFLVAAKQQAGPTALTYFKNRVAAYVGQLGAMTLPEGDLLKHLVKATLVDELSALARSCPSVVASLYQVVRLMANSSNAAVSRPATTALALGACAQMTATVLSLRFAMSIPGILNLDPLAIEFRRLAAGLEAIRDLGSARIADAHGATLRVLGTM